VVSLPETRFFCICAPARPDGCLLDDVEDICDLLNGRTGGDEGIGVIGQYLDVVIT
jgi:hypothetical protein